MNYKAYKKVYILIKIVSFVLFIITTKSYTQQKIILSEENADWSAVIGGKALCSPVNTSYGIAVLSDGKMVSALTESGNILWQKSVSSRSEPYFSSFSDDFLLIVGDSGKKLTLLNPSGLELWTVNNPFKILSAPITGRDSRIFVKGKKNIACYGVNGICKWNIETPELTQFPILELNDGTHIAFIASSDLSKAIRFTPFGEILEQITFSGLVVSASHCPFGIILLFSGGGIGLFSVESGKANTKWVISSKSDAFKETYPEKKSDILQLNDEISSALFYTNSGLRVIIFETSTGTVKNIFDAADVDPSKLYCVSTADFGNAIAVCDNKSAFVFDLLGSIKWAVSLPSEKNKLGKWNYISFTKSNHLILCSTSWIVSGFRTIQSPSSKKTTNTKKSYYHSFYDIDESYFKNTAFLEKIPEKFVGNNRREELLNGLYGTKEKDFAQALITFTTAYKTYLAEETSFVSRKEISLFSRDTVNTEKIIRQLALMGTDDFSQIISSLILSANTSSILNSLFVAAKECGYDPEGTVLSAIDRKLVFIKSNNTYTLNYLCEAVYEICRFMGRPALYSHGMNIMKKLLMPQYPVEVRSTARRTLEKIAVLKI